MDIMLNLDHTAFGIFVIVMTLFSNDVDSRSIFDIMIDLQPKECSSFTNHANRSIADPTVIYPPATSDRVNYEYEITTPNFPSIYPTNLQCITLIKAPNYDYKIVIEVREKFELEPSKNCGSDFLEICDGPYGFSNKIGKFCNSESIPKEISSSGPFLWLRFYSDTSLPNSGFKIVYRFIKQTMKPNLHYCYKQTIIPDDDSFKLNTSFLLSEFKNSTRINDNAIIPVECVFDFYVNPKSSTYFYKMKFPKQKHQPSCDDNFLEVYHTNTIPMESIPKKSSNYGRLCLEHDHKSQLFMESYRTSIRISVKDSSRLADFKVTLTPLKKIDKNKCPDDYLHCFPLWCISKKLVCYRDVKCDLINFEICSSSTQLKSSDDLNSNTTGVSALPVKPNEAEIALRKTNHTHAIILSSITVILILCMVVCLVITIHSKKKDRSKNRIHLAEIETKNQDSSQNKRLFYEPITTALSTDKLSRKDYGNNSIWSKRIDTDDTIASVNRNHESILKLNGGVTADSAIKTFHHKNPKMKIEKMKNISMNKIGKYLSVPNPSKNDCTQNSINSNQIGNQNHNFGVVPPSEDFQSMSSHSYSKQISSNKRSIHQHIQRASSMGSGLRKQLLEPMKDSEYTKNIEWYCGPVIRGSSIESSTRNDSSDMLNAYSAKSSTHVPGCRSLPNVNYIGLQNQVYYTNPVPINNGNHDITDSLDFSYDDNSSYKDETLSVKNHYIRDNSHKQFESKRNNDNFSSNYGFNYFCAHEPARSKDFVEYIA